MRIAIILVPFLLCGCTNLMGFRPTMAADPPLTGAEGRVLATELFYHYVPAGDDVDARCDRLRMSYQESERRLISRYSNNRGESAETIFACYRFRTHATNELRAEHVARYVMTGFALTDFYCDSYFERIAEHAGKRGFGRALTNDVGAAVSAVLGLAAAGSGLTGGIGAAFGLADSTWRNYDENFLVHADLPSLHQLVRSEQESIRAELDGTDAMPTDYPQGLIEILRYAQTCSFIGMRALLTESMVEKARSNANPLDGSRITDWVERSVAERQSMIEMLEALNVQTENSTDDEAIEPDP